MATMILITKALFSNYIEKRVDTLGKIGYNKYR